MHISSSLVDLDDCEALYGSTGDSLENTALHAHIKASAPDFIWTMTARTSIYLDFKLRSIAASKLTAEPIEITYTGADREPVIVAIDQDTDLSKQPFQLVTAILDHFEYPWQTGLAAASMARLEETMGFSRDTMAYGLPKVGFIGPRNVFFYCPIEEGFESYGPAESAIVAGTYPGLAGVKPAELLDCSQSMIDHIQRMEARLSEARSGNAHHQEVRVLLRQQREAMEVRLASGDTSTLALATPLSKAEYMLRRQALDHLIIGELILDDNKYYSFVYVLTQLQQQLLEGDDCPADLTTLKLTFYDDKTPNLNAFLRAVALFNREIFGPAGVTIEAEAYLVNKVTGEPTRYLPQPTVFIIDSGEIDYETLDAQLRDQAFYQKGRITSSLIFVGKPDPTLAVICSKYGIPYTKVASPHQATTLMLGQSGKLACPAGGRWDAVKMVSVSTDSKFHETVEGVNGCTCVKTGADKLAELATAVEAADTIDLVKAQSDRESRISSARWATIGAGALFLGAALLAKACGGSSGPSL